MLKYEWIEQTTSRHLLGKYFHDLQSSQMWQALALSKQAILEKTMTPNQEQWQV